MPQLDLCQITCAERHSFIDSLLQLIRALSLNVLHWGVKLGIETFDYIFRTSLRKRMTKYVSIKVPNLIKLITSRPWLIWSKSERSSTNPCLRLQYHVTWPSIFGSLLYSGDLNNKLVQHSGGSNSERIQNSNSQMSFECGMVWFSIAVRKRNATFKNWTKMVAVCVGQSRLDYNFKTFGNPINLEFEHSEFEPRLYSKWSKPVRSRNGLLCRS